MSGVGELIKGMGATFVRGTPSEKMYSENQPLALAAIDKFNTFVRDSLPKLATFDWRMGREMFDTKWRYYLQSTITPEQMLKSRLARGLEQRRKSFSDPGTVRSRVRGWRSACDEGNDVERSPSRASRASAAALTAGRASGRKSRRRTAGCSRGKPGSARAAS